MNKSFSKNKEKRPRTSSNETNTSFVKNVTSRVSGLLPATITKWFSSPSSSNANGSTPTAEVTDSSTEDEGPESPIVTQPPAKRMRYNTSSKFSLYGPSDVNCTTSKIEITEIPGSHYPGTQFPINRNSIALSPIRTPNETFTNEIREENKRDTLRLKSTQHTVSSIGKSVAAKRKSIFDKSRDEEPPKPTVKPPPSAEKRPCFKPTLLGSPFYPGRTMYGGAASSYLHQPNIQQHTVALVKETKSSEDSAMSSSARRIMDLLESYSSPLMEARRIPQYTKPKHESFNTSTERFAPYANKSLSSKTQELHVPGIASILRLKQRSRLMDCTKTARQIIASHSSASSYPLTYTPVSYPPVTSNTTNTTQTTQPSQLRQETEKEQDNKMTTKVKTRVARTNRGMPDVLDIATPVKLPAATLQIDQNKLPKFSFTSASNLPATSTPKVIPPAPKMTDTKKNSEVSTSKPETVTSSSIFKFSNPVKISSDTPDAGATPPKFIFDSPERRIEQHSDRKSDVSSVVGNFNETDKSATKAKDWSCPDCWVNNKADVNKCLCCGHKKAVKAAKCSMCKLADSQAEKDKCVNCEKMVSLPSIKSSQSSKWQCDGCWVMNENNVAKCVCCGAKKPTEASKAAPTVKVSDFTAFSNVKQPSSGGCFTVGSQSTLKSDSKQEKPLPPASNADSFSKPSVESDNTLTSLGKTQKSQQWECAGCLVMNESDRSLCHCCGKLNKSQVTFSSYPKETKPPLLHSNTSSFFGTTDKGDSTFITLAKSQKSDKWECSSCLVMNESDQSVCVCCGAEKEPKSKLPQTKFNFGVNNTSFKFGIEPKVQEATITKQPEVQAITETKLKEQSETNNNVLAETPTFTFTLPTKKIETKIDTLKAKPAEAVKFSFGIPKDASVAPVNKSESVKIPEEDTEKAQEVPEVNLKAPVLENPKIAFGSFNTTVTEVEKEKKLIPPPNLFASPTVVTKTDTPSNPMTSQPAVPSVEKPPLQNTFTLGSSTLKPASNLFGTPTVGNSASLFAAPSQSTAVTTSTPTVAPLLSVVPAQTTTNVAPAPAAPMFSFGTNGVNSPAPMSAVASATATADKPKFQFTFGSNPIKTEAAPAMLGTTNVQPVMKSMFAPSGENNKSMNAFSLTPANSLGSSNAMNSNALGGSNGLAPSNGFGGNTLSGNPIGGNTLSGNSLSSNLLTGNAMASNTFSTNNLTGGNSGSSTNTLGANGLPGNPLTGGNGLQPNNTLSNSATNIFGGTVQKENMWNTNNNAPASNMFVPNTTTNSLQKPPSFTFGTTTPFNATSSTPAFGSNAQPAPNIFGMDQNQNNNVQPSLFSNPVQNQNPAPMFGSPAPNNNPAPQMDMFATQNIGTTPTFGTSNSSIGSFEVSSMTPAPAPAPAFNFGASSQQPSGIFGFGQQQQQPQATGGFNFGAPPAGAPQGGVQFAMGTAPGTRKIRKARRSNIR